MSEYTKQLTNHESSHQFRSLYVPVHRLQTVFEYIDLAPEAATQIAEAGDSLSGLEVDEADFIIGFFDAASEQYRLDIDEDKIEVEGLFEDAVNGEIDTIAAGIDKINGLVDPFKYHILAIEQRGKLLRRYRQVSYARTGYRLNQSATNPENRFIKYSNQLARDLTDLTSYPTQALTEQALRLNELSLRSLVAKAQRGVPSTIRSTKPRPQETGETDIKTTVVEAELKSSENSQALPKMPNVVEHKFDWMDEPELFDVQIIGGAAVIDATHSKLTDISDAIERSDPRYKTRFEQLIKKHAKRIGAGVMPWETNVNIKRVAGNGGVYDETTLWQSFDRSPNAPKIFYTVIPATDEIIAAGGSKAIMVLLGKTDKAHEIDTLSQITSRSRSRLRAGYAGA